MKTMTIVRYKPKPEHYDLFLSDLISASGRSHYIASRDDEVLHVWVSKSIDRLTDEQPGALSWLDEHRHMLQEYSEEEGHTRVITGFVEKEPIQQPSKA